VSEGRRTEYTYIAVSLSQRSLLRPLLEKAELCLADSKFQYTVGLKEHDVVLQRQDCRDSEGVPRRAVIMALS